ncbi:MAG: hypothetical protein U0236_21345 [Nitrospira sp.]
MSRGQVIVSTEFKRVGDFTFHAWKSRNGFEWAVYEHSNRRMSGLASSMAKAKLFALDAFKQWRQGRPRMLFNASVSGWRDVSTTPLTFEKRMADGVTLGVTMQDKRSEWWVSDHGKTVMRGDSDYLGEAKVFAEDAYRAWKRRTPKMLFNPIEERYVDAAMKGKGYRYKLVPNSGKFDALYAKTAVHIAQWMKEYPQEQFGIIDLNTGKKLSSRMFLFNPGSGGMGYDIQMGRWYKLEQGQFKKWAMYLPEGRIEVKWHAAGYCKWRVIKGSALGPLGTGAAGTMEAAAKQGLDYYKRHIGPIPPPSKHPRMLFNPALAEKWDCMTRVQRVSLLRLVGVLPEAVDKVASQPWASVPFAVKMKLKWAWKENKRRVRKNDDPRFEKLAHAQRGKPESAMMRLSMAQISQLYGATAEHVGDLTHRMSQRIGFFKGGFQWVEEKVRKTLRWLTNPYGFEREVLEQVATNFKYMKELQEKRGTPFPKHYGKSPQDALLRLKRLGRLYAAEHRKLPVFNAVQRIARDAAIAVGEWRFKDAVDRLRALKALLDQGPEVWSREAMRTKNNPRPKNPWAICTAAVGRSDRAKYERCVLGVKAKMNPGKMQREIVQAFLAHRSKRMGLTTPMHGGTRRHRYSTDGESLYVWGNEVAYHRPPRTVGIVDAGWRTLLTRNVLNEVLSQLGLGSRIWTRRGKWVIDGQEWTGSAVIRDGRLTIGLPEAAPRSQFSGYTRRSRPKRYVPPPPEARMLFNSRPRRKVRFNMHTQKERAEASKLFHRVYAIAYRAIQQKNWMLFAEKYGIMWGLWHAASIERPPLTRLVNAWYKAIDEIKRLAVSSGYARF